MSPPVTIEKETATAQDAQHGRTRRARLPGMARKTSRARGGAIHDEIARIAKKIQEAVEEITESGNRMADGFRQYIDTRDQEMAKTWDTIQVGSGGKAYGFLMESMLLDAGAKQYLTDTFNMGRQKRVYRKRTITAA
jgi:hypothetical protein